MARYKTTPTTKTDCFAFGERSCKALKDRYCDFEHCKFYKPKTEVDEIEKPKKVDKSTKNIPQQ